MRKYLTEFIGTFFLVLTIGLGVRQSFGIFLKPVSAELHVGRELFSFGTAISMLLMGAVAPFAGRLCDRFGSAITIAGGSIVYVAGMVVTALMHDGFLLVLGNILVGVGLSAASFGPVLGELDLHLIGGEAQRDHGRLEAEGDAALRRDAPVVFPVGR